MNLSQFLALIQLRFRLSSNQIRKGGQLNSVLFSILAVAIFLFSLVSLVSSAAFGVVLLSNRKPSDILFVWNVLTAVFLVMWSFHVMNRIQQNDAISVEKLLHLPMTFSGAFLLNYVSSFANLTLLMIAPTMIGLALAMPFARNGASAVAIPLTFSFMFMITALTWQFRSWLSEKMQNKRTRGILMAVLPLMFIGLFVAAVEFTESSLFNILADLPLGWLPAGIHAAETGNWLSGVIGSLAMIAIGCGSLFFAFNSSLRRFTGATSGRAAVATSDSRSNAVNWRQSRVFASIPGTSDAVSGIAMATIYSLRRAPEVFAALVPVAVLAVFGTPYLIGMEGYTVASYAVEVLPIGLISVALLGFPGFLFSTFSYDRDAFRAYVLGPVQRQDVLFGKNLAIGVPTVILGWLTMIVVQCFFPVGLLWFLGGLVCLIASFLFLCIIGNAISIFFAVGLKRGSMTPVNTSIIPVLMLYLGVLGGPMVALIPTSVCFIIAKLLASVMPTGWLFLLLALIQLVVAWFVYRRSLVALGASLWRRESDLLGVVANIPE